MKSIAFLICTVAVSYSTQVHAISLRCDGDLALIRDSRPAVLQKCGEPFFTESFCRPQSQDVVLLPIGSHVPLLPVVPCLVVEDWYYNPGPGQLIAILRFESGHLTSIRYGDRVK